MIGDSTHRREFRPRRRFDGPPSVARFVAALDPLDGHPDPFVIGEALNELLAAAREADVRAWLRAEGRAAVATGLEVVARSMPGRALSMASRVFAALVDGGAP
jgi:hypothetical protein